MRCATFILLFLALATVGAKAENCGKSREYLLGGMAGDLPMPPQAYEDLFKTCLATSAMANVKDAYILKDGGIAIAPKKDSISATAATLSQFCNSYPRATLRFLNRKEISQLKSLVDIIRTTSGSATSCRKIKGIS
ncbi:hypothetical protein [Rhodopseudomonas sp. P2A-2r]|uniref:hypothetical protein n=1 Tax=unclassified Rhodopseudomonas TaxID=2638247 RepID=UPI00223482FF|nr:hypothetical protein [Rhodopseudomonas sp. P2A-2r]UZE47501.1 hypothetical protein ONR75_21545 [Rhodopseudomonas sp. P2A-2r]